MRPVAAPESGPRVRVPALGWRPRLSEPRLPLRRGQRACRARPCPPLPSPPGAPRVAPAGGRAPAALTPAPRRHHPGRGGGGELRPRHRQLDAAQPGPQVRQQLRGGRLPGPALPGGLQRLQVQRAGPAVLQPCHRWAPPAVGARRAVLGAWAPGDSGQVVTAPSARLRSHLSEWRGDAQGQAGFRGWEAERVTCTGHLHSPHPG